MFILVFRFAKLSIIILKERKMKLVILSINLNLIYTQIQNHKYLILL